MIDLEKERKEFETLFCFDSNKFEFAHNITKYVAKNNDDAMLVASINFSWSGWLACCSEKQIEIDVLKAESAQAYNEAAYLAKALFKKYYSDQECYKSGQSTWGLCNTTAGIITQIDNMVSVLHSDSYVNTLKAHIEELQKPKVCTLQNIGCNALKIRCEDTYSLFAFCPCCGGKIKVQNG